MDSQSDLIDFRELAVLLRRGTPWIVGATAGGLLVAALITLLLPPRYEGEATVLLQPSDPGAPLGLSGLGGLGDLAGVLGGSASTGFDTEVQIMTSRSVIEEVVDSLALQVRVTKPAGVAPSRLVASVQTPEGFTTEEVTARRDGDGYRLSSEGGDVRATAGVPARLPSGADLVLQRGALPETFTLEIMGPYAAVARVRRRLAVEEPGGQVARLVYEAGDAATAAAVPNAVVARYLTRRKGQDRGVNQRRYEFLVEKTDSIAAELGAAEAALRQFQEASGVLDPELTGRVDVERAMELESELETLRVEARTLRQILAETADGNVPARSLAAYPTFLRNAAINSLLEQLLTTESERIQLLQRRTTQDPEVIALSETIEQLERQLTSLSLAYLTGVERQTTQVDQELNRHRAALATLPESAEESYRRQRDVRLLSEMLAALQGQQLQARLGTIAEGGDVRLIDPAVVPEAPSSPILPLNLAIGLLGGFVVGVVAALGRGYFGSRVTDELDAQLATGLPAATLRPNAPLFLSGAEHLGTILVLAVGGGAPAASVARRIAATAAVRGGRVALASLEEDRATAGGGSNGDTGGLPVHVDTVDVPVVYTHVGNSSPGGVREVIEDLEQRFDLVIAALPPLESPVTTAVVVPPRRVVLSVDAGRVHRAELRRTSRLLDRLQVPVVGIVVTNATDAR